MQTPKYINVWSLIGYKNGRNVKVVTVTDMDDKMYDDKKGAYKIEKHTIGTYRVGINHANTKWTKDRVKNGIAIAPRKWGSWSTIAGEINKIIKYDGKDYAVLYPSSKGWNMTTYYLVNGVKMDTKQVQALGVLKSKAFSHISNDTPYITYKMENIDSIIVKGVTYR